MSGRIQIETQRAQLDISSRRAQLNIVRPRPRMRVRTVRAQMNIERKLPTFKVNWTKVRAESGLAPPIQLTLQRRDRAKQLTSEAIARIAQDARQMSAFHTGVNAVAEISRQRSLEADHVELNLGTMPQSPPEISWDPGYMVIDWTPAELQIEWDVDIKPQITVEPHSVEIRMRNYPTIKITFIPDEQQKTAGRKVDRHI